MRDGSAILFALIARDGAVCYLCGQGPIEDDPFEIEHRKPREAGGEGDLTDLANLGLAHRSCNRTKGTRAVAS